MTDAIPFHGSEFREKVIKTLDHYARRLNRAGRDALWHLRPVTADRPVFVVGCSRAGTTLVYKTLSMSPGLGSLNRETHDYWQSLHPIEERGWRSHVLRAGDVGMADRAAVTRYFYVNTGMRRFVDKNNQNGLCLGYLHALFPDAHFVYVKRSPGDNINSLMEGWRRPGEFATWSEHLPARLAIDNGGVTRWCFFLPEGWRDYVAAALEEVCAFQYRSMNQAIIADSGAIPREQWHEVHYEDLVTDPLSSFERIYSDCGLRFTGQVREHCRTVLDNPYNAFSNIALDKWKQGDDVNRIQRVLPLVEETATKMGY